MLVVLCAQMRANRRIRRGMTTLVAAYRHSPLPRWYGLFARQVHTMWLLYKKMALPKEKTVGPHIAASRGMRRLLSHAGLAADRLPPLAPHAHARINALWRSLEGKQAMVAYDNRCRRWYCSAPA